MTRRSLYLCVLAWLGSCPLAAAQSTASFTQSDFGGVGLLQTPTARMNDAGEVALTANRTAPYTRFGFTLQPLDWLEGSFRYTNVTDRQYGPVSLSGHQHYKDKSIDLKLRLWQESHWLPALAVGGRDIGGTGLFSGEFVVASKRFDRFDVSLGLGWGYLGARGNLGNPLGWLDDRFNTRPAPPKGAQAAGEFNGNSYFRGRTSLFGGVEYHASWVPLDFKLEYDGNDYRHEPQNNNQPQSSPFNLGVVYRLNHSLDLSMALERGNTAMFGLTLHTNLAQAPSAPKLLDPPPVPLHPAAPRRPAEQADWAAISRRLHDNAGLEVTRVARHGHELIVTGEQQRYFYPAQGVGRTSRILDQTLTPDIDWFTVVTTRKGLPVAQTSVHRKPFEQFIAHDLAPDDFRRSVERDAPAASSDGLPLYQAPLHRFSGGLGLGYSQTLGGPDAFILYQLYANYDAEYRLSRHVWLSGQADADLFNNYSQFKYDAPTGLPRVRTYQREYLTTSRLTMPNLQLNAASELAPDWYGMVYGGYLESMYGGLGGEVLYRPYGARWAVGMDLNRVRQRSFDQHLGLRGYEVTTGHVSAYVDTGIDHVLAIVSVGRYLAGDTGGTLDLSRQFRNGVRMGAYATFTNVSAKQFGEGRFDKGIYLSIPFDLMLPRSSTARANLLWQPLVRDGGAILGRRYSLYTLTDEHDPRLFDDNFDAIAQ